MRMDGVDDMARASARRYEWRVWTASRTGSGAQQCAEQGWQVRVARGNRHKHVAVASKAATSSTLSAYVRRGGQLPERGWKKSKPPEGGLGVMRAHTSGETFRRGSTQWAHSKAGQGVGQRTGGSVAGR